VAEDPLNSYEPPPLAEQIVPYRRFGDDELALTLLAFSKKFGGPGIATPADTGMSFYCPGCEENVRHVTRPDEVMVCPLCGERPGILAIGRGPR